MLMIEEITPRSSKCSSAKSSKKKKGVTKKTINQTKQNKHENKE